MAIAHNPNISVARLLALAQAQVTREVRSGELPTATGSLTAVGAHENSRITAGFLNNPSIYDRAAGGLTVTQLITDFGRTHNLVRSAQSNAKAQLEDERATELDITLTVDQAFYHALTSQAVLKVAEGTVNQRLATADQVGALAKQKLRSSLDLSFANVQLSQAKLLLLDAQNSAADAMASLNTVLGSEQDVQYALVDETTARAVPR
jgi:outer membrane protein